MKLSGNKILVTGGAGFIGSFVVDKLVSIGAEVIIYDNLTPQVHLDGTPPDYLNPNAEFIQGDVLDYEKFKSVIGRVNGIVHLAAAVGVGQSQYEIKHYVNTNTGGTANLLDILVNNDHNIEKMVVAASMSSYGEGNYLCEKDGVVRPNLRTEEQMAKGDWELYCPLCGARVEPVPTGEDAVQYCNSIYAMTKKDQEDMILNIGKTYDLPAVALRFFNVYGPRQSLSNPYTGVAAIFLSRIKNGQSPLIFEDGLQTRDFISVHDIADVICTVMEDEKADMEVFNVGSGIPLSIKSISDTLAELYGKDIAPNITNKFRKGDVRHCFADISKIKNKIGWEPRITFSEGMEELINWGRDARADDKFEQSIKELKDKGIV